MIGVWSQYGYGPLPTPQYGDLIVVLLSSTNLSYGASDPALVAKDGVVGLYRGGCMDTVSGTMTVAYGAWWTTLPSPLARMNPY